MNQYNLKSDKLSVKPKSNWKVDEHKTKKGYLLKKFIEFCERTDLHGYKYIVMKELPYAERVCWAVFVTLSTVCAAWFVIAAYCWYARNPIVTVIESTQGAIWDIPFPAVTICDLNIISRKSALAFAHNLTLPGHVTAKYVFEILRLVPFLHSTFHANDEQKNKLSELQYILDINNISMDTLFRILSPAASCNHLLQRCMWKNTQYRCDQLFQQVFMMLTLCCSFNYYAIDSNVNNVDDYSYNTKKPRHVSSCGYQTGLTVHVNINSEDYYSASFGSLGVMVFIDSAYNIPNMNSPMRMVNPPNELLIALNPERTYTTPDVKAFGSKQRQCYYNDEVKIGDFRHYSFHNCLSYQIAITIKKYCSCLPFFILSKEHHRRCNFNDIDCIELTLSTCHIFEENKTATSFVCLPECEHYYYPMEVALGKLTNKFSGDAFYNNVNISNQSILNVFFNDLVSTRYRSDVYLNWQNLLGTIGGLLSLMFGFTLISGIDFILFMVCHVVCDSVKIGIVRKGDYKIHREEMKNKELRPRQYLNHKIIRKNLKKSQINIYDSKRF